MKLGVHIAVAGVVLMGASAGVLYPIQSSVSTIEDDVGTLLAERTVHADVHKQFMQAQTELIEMEERVLGRGYTLCPDTPEALQTFERSLLGLVDESGLYSIRMDRRSEVRSGQYPHLGYELVVEGDAYALHGFLVELEALQWVTRVTGVSIEPGDERRRITLQVAVILEKKGSS